MNDIIINMDSDIKMNELINSILINMSFNGKWKTIQNDNLYTTEQIANELIKKNINVSYFSDNYMAFSKEKMHFSIIKKSNYIQIQCNYKLI